MASKEIQSNQICANDKQSQNGGQFSNLNLCQTQKCPNASSVQSYSKSNKELKQFSYTVTNNCQEKEKLWNKSTKTSSLRKFKNVRLSHEDEEDKIQKQWKKDTKIRNVISSSTLSLHIAIYENSVIKVSNEDKDLSKKCKSLKPIVSKFQDHFEFPRQMGGIQPTTPQIMHFKASQTLLSPNQGSPNQRSPTAHRQPQPTFTSIQKLQSMQRRTSIDLSHSEEVSF